MGLRGIRRRIIGSRADPYDDWNRYAAPAKPKFGYHTSNALTSMADRHGSAASGTPAGPRRRRSNHRHPAVHVQRLAGDVGGLLRGEKDRGSRHIRPRAEPARGDSGKDRLPLLVAELVGHRRGDQARRDAVRRHAAFGIFGGDRLDHADHPGLGRGVIALTGIAGDADHRGDADDAAETLPHHPAYRRPREAEGRRQIDCNDLVPVLVSQLNQEVVLAIPALATKISSLPMASSHFGTSASTSSLSARLHGNTWMRSLSSPES